MAKILVVGDHATNRELSVNYKGHSLLDQDLNSVGMDKEP